MRIKQLPDNKKGELREAYKGTKSVSEKTRYHALWLVSRGGKHKDVCALIDIKEKTLLHWIALYRKGGITALRDKPQPGNNRKLIRKQKDEIKKVLNEKTPRDMGYEGSFWNVPLLKTMIRKQYGVTYSSTTSYRTLFHACGFTFHKPKRVNKKQNPYMRKRFEDVIKKNSDGTVEKIVWSW